MAAYRTKCQLLADARSDLFTFFRLSRQTSNYPEEIQKNKYTAAICIDLTLADGAEMFGHVTACKKKKQFSYTLTRNSSFRSHKSV